MNGIGSMANAVGRGRENPGNAARKPSLGGAGKPDPFLRAAAGAFGMPKVERATGPFALKIRRFLVEFADVFIPAGDPWKTA
jgi:hypothetical protein